MERIILQGLRTAKSESLFTGIGLTSQSGYHLVRTAATWM